jgi:hypothetical protein
MVFIVEPGLMPSPKIGFHWEFKEATARASLKTYAPGNREVFSTGLVFQEEVILKQRKAQGTLRKAS